MMFRRSLQSLSFLFALVALGCSLPNSTVESGLGKLEFRLSLSAPAAKALQARNIADAGVASIRITLSSKWGKHIATAVDQGGGNFQTQFDGLTPGAWRLEASLLDVSDTELYSGIADVFVEPNRVVPVHMTVTANGSGVSSGVDTGPGTDVQSITLDTSMLLTEPLGSGTRFALPEGTQRQLVVTFDPPNATNRTLKWTSDNPSVAEIDRDGVIHARSTGEFHVTVEAADGAPSLQLAVVVDPPYVGTWQTPSNNGMETYVFTHDHFRHFTEYGSDDLGDLFGDDGSLFPGDSSNEFRLSNDKVYNRTIGTFLPAQTSSTTWIWKATPETLFIDDGDGGDATYYRVSDQPLTGLTFTPALQLSYQLPVGSPLILGSASYLPAVSALRSFAWVSSDFSVVGLDGNGYSGGVPGEVDGISGATGHLIGLRPGSAHVKAVSPDRGVVLAQFDVAISAGIPTNVAATAGYGQVTLAWTSAAYATGYKVYYQVGPGASTSSTLATGFVSSNSARIEGLTNGVAYSFVVVATSAGPDSVPSVEASATPDANLENFPGLALRGSVLDPSWNTIRKFAKVTPGLWVGAFSTVAAQSEFKFVLTANGTWGVGGGVDDVGFGQIALGNSNLALSGNGPYHNFGGFFGTGSVLAVVDERAPGGLGFDLAQGGDATPYPHDNPNIPTTVQVQGDFGPLPMSYLGNHRWLAYLPGAQNALGAVFGGNPQFSYVPVGNASTFWGPAGPGTYFNNNHTQNLFNFVDGHDILFYFNDLDNTAQAIDLSALQ